MYQINERLNEIDIEIKAYSDNIESLEEKLDFVNTKHSNMECELINLSPEDIE